MPGPDPRAAVRVAALDRTLDAFNDEQGRKVALSISVALGRYHEQYVAPIEARIASLERPWWKRFLP